MGKSEDLLNMIVFDVETTGISPLNDRIIEIGAIKIRGGKITSELSTLVNPGVCIPPRITDITGITDAMIANQPRIEEVLPEFLAFCEEDIILGHNISFDYSFIKASCVKEGLAFNKQAVDTLTIARKFLKGLPSRSLGGLCEHYNISLTQAHRAVHDARATYALFRCLQEQFYEHAPESFTARQMTWTPPKQDMITDRQKKYLQSLVRSHNKNLDREITTYTKTEASRLIDQILREIRQGAMLG